MTRNEFITKITALGWAQHPDQLDMWHHEDRITGIALFVNDNTFTTSVGKFRQLTYCDTNVYIIYKFTQLINDLKGYVHD